MTFLEIERRNRIRAALYAYAYEFEAHNLVSDTAFDQLCLETFAGLSVDTDRPELDTWFRQHFQPFTGQWIYQHPERDRLAAIYRRLTYKPRQHVPTDKEQAGLW